MSAFGSVKQDNRKKVLECISRHPEGITGRAVAAELGLDTYEVRGHVVTMSNNGIIRPIDPMDKVKRWRLRF